MMDVFWIFYYDFFLKIKFEVEQLFNGLKLGIYLVWNSIEVIRHMNVI